MVSGESSRPGYVCVFQAVLPVDPAFGRGRGHIERCAGLSRRGGLGEGI
jgi:hypothetical protein